MSIVIGLLTPPENETVLKNFYIFQKRCGQCYNRYGMMADKYGCDTSLFGDTSIQRDGTGDSGAGNNLAIPEEKLAG